MELSVWPSDYGLVSIDPECIRQLAYMKFAEVPFNLKYSNNPLRFNTSTLPVFKDAEFTFSDFGPMVEHLRFKRYSLDFGLSTKSCSEMLAVMSLLMKMLQPISEFIFWVDKRNYEEVTRPWFTKTMPSLLSIFYLRKRKQQAVDLLRVHYPALATEMELHTHLKMVAGDCFDILSTRLGSNLFFYGAGPSSLDCMVYAYIAPMLKVPFPSNEIISVIHNYPKLIEYIKRIDTKYFADVKPKAAVVIDADEKYDDVMASYKMKAFTLSFVVCAMVGYAVSNKLVNVSRISAG